MTCTTPGTAGAAGRQPADPHPHLADPTVLEALQRKADFKHYRPKQFSMREFLQLRGP